MKNTIIRENSYHDSVTLMSLSSKILSVHGVIEAVISMATDMNKELLENVGLDTEESDNASSNDLIIAIEAEDEESYNEALNLVDELLSPKSQKKTRGGEVEDPKTIDKALEYMDDANMAIISVPGEFAAREARKALNEGLHVMLFSDNVSLEDEKEIKELGREKGLLVMGPDCGTARINDVGLCFANEVRNGNIGIVGASGTGLQEVMVQVHRLGGGISQAIGTGGRDLGEEIGGIMMLEGLKALNEDDSTEIIVLISKPPAKSVEEKILEEVEKVDKPVVICFIDGDENQKDHNNIHFVQGLYEAAEKSVELVNNEELKVSSKGDKFNIEELKSKLKPEQKYFRGLFSGGTLCGEALSVLRGKLGNIQSNVSSEEYEKLEDLEEYSGNVLLDLGEDEFTQGKPHPMIDPSLRLEKIVEEAYDEEVGVILMDFVLGYGSHEDPAGASIESIREAREIANDSGRDLIFVAYICGTELDSQNYSQQKEALEDEGVVVTESNLEAAKMVMEILAK